MANNEETIGLSDYLGVLRRRAWVIVLSVVVVTGAALAISLLQEKTYEGQASLLFRDPGFEGRLFGGEVFADQDSDRQAATNFRLVSLDAVAERAAEDLDGGELSGDEFADKVAVEKAGESDVVQITATDGDPVFAAELANQFGKSYIEFRREADRSKISSARRLVQQDFDSFTETEQRSEEGKSLQNQISLLRTLEALQTGNAELVEIAEPAEDPSSPQLRRNLAIGATLGLLIGIAAAFVLERFDRRLKDTNALEDAYGLPVLGTVPESDALETSHGLAELSFAEVESFRMLRTRLRYFNADRDIKSVLITSSAPLDGKSTIAWFLASVAARGGTKAIVIDADFHKGTIAAAHDLAPIPGLSEALTHQTPLEEVIQHVPVEPSTNPNGDADEGPRLDVITSGVSPPNPVGLMESEEMGSLLAELEQEYELVVIDTPPISVLADAIPLMRLVSGVIVVAELGRDTREEALDLRTQLVNLDAPALGLVVNRAKLANRYGYGSYGYGAGAEIRPPVGTGS